MRKMIGMISAVFLLLISTSFRGGGLASPVSREKTPPREKPLQHEVTVTLKLVQVYVTDKDGKPVTNLKKEDFILFDNGRPQVITDYESHILPLVEEKPEVRQVETPLPPARLNRKFFLVFDVLRNDAQGMAKSKEAALHFLETSILPTDEIGVLCFTDIRGIVIYEYLTSDHARVRKIIKEMKEVIPGAAESNLATPFNLNLEMQMAEAEKGIENQGSDATPGFARAGGVGANPEAEWKEKKIIDYTVRFQEMAKALRTISGYKNIVFFTNGFPRAYVEGNVVFRSYWEAAGKELASASAPVFTVNALGRRDNFNRSEMRADTSLKMLSDLSGGKYLGDVAETGRIADEIQSATSNYYILGYPIDRQWDGKFHEVRVEVKPKGYRVHAQGGYFNPKPFNKMSSLEKQIQLIDLALNEKPFDQEPLRFSACALPFSGAGAPNVVVMSEIPPDRFKGELGNRLEYTTLIIDGTNNIVTSERSELDLRRTESSALYGYIVSSLRPGQYNCRIVLRSLETGRAAVASSRVAIPESEGTEPGAPFLSLYPPLLLVPNKPAVYLKLSREKNPAPDSPANTLQQIYQFVSSEHSPLVVHLPAGVVKLLAVVRCRAAGFTTSGESRVEFTADLMADPPAAKTELSLDILDAKKLEGTDAVLLEVGLPELKSGRYRLEFTAKETSTGRESRTSRNLVVK